MSDVVNVSLPDGSAKQVARGTTIHDFVRTQIGAGLAKAAVFARLGDEDVDLSRPLDADAKLRIFTTRDPEALEVARHDAAHVVASVVQRLFPGTQVTIGPVIEDGFYYDFFRETAFTPDDLQKIELATNELIAKDLPFVRREVTKDEAVALFGGLGETFKLEIIEDIFQKGAKALTLYSHGDWTDFCLGPHGPGTARIGVVKLTSVAGAYWRGNPKNPMLQRIYGTAFFDKKALDQHLSRLEEAKKRDHRRLGKELDLFHFFPIAPGAAFWTHKGTRLYHVLGDAMRRLMLRSDYEEIKTPLLYNTALWEQSGHWGKYKENMFLVLDNESQEHDFSLKPMNCPSHHVFFGSRRRSYRELPLRYHTQDVLHRNEAAGALSGLTRLRQFQQDDAHIYLAEAQIADEVQRLVSFVDKVYAAFGLTYTAKFATRPEQRIGDDAMWDRAEGALKAALEKTKLAYELKPGDGAFYGPKIDFDVSDSIGRKWQLGTIQLDYAAPERFDLSYTGDDNQSHRPVVIHRAIFGSFERFIAICIEHYAGAFPAWLAPVQARIVTVTDRQHDWAMEVKERLLDADVRVELDERNEKLGAKIRDAQMEKIPFTLVIGDNEVEAKGVAPRRYGGADLKTMPLEAAVELLVKEGRVPFLERSST